jgi:vacuolar-type H+-ATPase subunit I/STV1
MMMMMSTTAVSSFTVASSSSRRHRMRDCLRGGGGAKMNSLQYATTTTRKKKRGVAVEVNAMGWFSNNKDIDGRDETFRRQQEILAKRRKGGRIDEEANKRRAKVSGFMKKTLSKKEMDEIKKQNTQAANKLSKEAVKGGIPFPMASFGMPEFDGGERFDLRGPYADEGWVDEKDLEKQKKKLKNKGKGGGGLFGGLFGK